MPSLNFQTELEQLLGSRPLIRSALKYEVVLSLLAFSLFWGGLLIYSGTLTSGYHLIDDWELLSISDSLHQSNLLTVTAENVRNDLTIRLRPWFYIQRIFTVWLVGFNPTLLSLQLLVILVLSSLFLYMFARNVGFGPINSLLFVFLTFLGRQASIWWFRGTAEPVGIFWLAAGLLFMAKSITRPENRRLYTVISLTGFILSSLTKESFVVLLPVVALAWLMLYYRNNDVSAFDALRACAMPVLTLAIVCITDLTVILFKTGTTTIGYAGFDSQSLAIPTLYATLKNLLAFSNGYWIVILLVVLTILLLASLTQRPQVSLMVELVAVALLILLSTVSQVLLYAKSGINDRYLIPGTLSLAFLVIYLIAKIEQLVKPQSLRVAVSIMLVLGTLLSLSAQAATSWAFARTYAAEGPPLQQALEKIGSSTRNSDVIVLAADPARDFEGSIAVREYLRVLFDRKKVFVYLLWASPEDDYSVFERELGKSYDKDLGEFNFGRVGDKSQVKAIFTYTHASTDKAFQENVPDWFRPSEFMRSDYGLFVVYTAR